MLAVQSDLLQRLTRPRSAQVIPFPKKFRRRRRSPHRQFWRDAINAALDEQLPGLPHLVP
jgi:hypothetical protein